MDGPSRSRPGSPRGFASSLRRFLPRSFCLGGSGNMSDEVEVVERYLTRDEVLKRVPVSQVTLWNWRKAGTFPPPRTLSGGQGRTNRVAWLESEVVAWMKSRPVREYRPQQKTGDREISEAQQRLLDAGKIKIESHGPVSKPKKG